MSIDFGHNNTAFVMYEIELMITGSTKLGGYSFSLQKLEHVGETFTDTKLQHLFDMTVIVHKNDIFDRVRNASGTIRQCCDHIFRPIDGYLLRTPNDL